MKILAIDSSAGAGSVAIMEDKTLRGETFVNVGLTHSQTLMPMLADLLKNTNILLENIDVFAVSVGPGSFTGLRIGLASVKGLAFANETPCIAVSTLLSMAYNFFFEDVTVCAVMDAHCNQFYSAIFDVCAEKITRLTPDKVLSFEKLCAEISNLEKKVVFVGDGAFLCYNKIVSDSTFKDKEIFLAPKGKRFQKASSVAFAAYDDYLKNGSKALIRAKDLVPKYLKLSQAERNLNQKHYKGK